MRLSVFLLLLCLPACTASHQQIHAAAQQRAAFDLDCPTDDITTSQLGETNVIGRTPQQPGLERTVVGARGCGQKAVYVVECVGAVGTPTCNALLNADTRPDASGGE